MRQSLGMTGKESADELSLKLNGIILAKTSATGEDGIVTANDIAGYNLGQTDMVVLSACETGLGALKSDGVFGLQRGFKKAGAGAIIMSLWSVADQPTQEMMSRFYAEWVKSGDKYDAFSRARAYIRQKYNNPEYWAAFILLDAL